MIKWNGEDEAPDPLCLCGGAINVSLMPSLHSQPLFKDPLPHQEAEPPHFSLLILKICLHLPFFQHLYGPAPG